MLFTILDFIRYKKIAVLRDGVPIPFILAIDSPHNYIMK